MQYTHYLTERYLNLEIQNSIMDTAVKGVIIKDNKLLLLKQNVNGKCWYSLPGGRVEDSDFESELLREIKEETNLDVEIVNYIGDWFFIRESDGTKTICKTFMCKAISKNLDAVNSEKYEDIVDFIWVTKNEFLNNNYTKDESLLKLFREIEF